jgi:hypothetical protein
VSYLQPCLNSSSRIAIKMHEALPRTICFCLVLLDLVFSCQTLPHISLINPALSHEN